MIEIITHSYASKLPQYATLLRYQLASITKWYPIIKTRVTVCCCTNDTLVNNVVEEFSDYNDNFVTRLFLDKGELFRRSIGRHQAIKYVDNRTEVVWYTDCDHVFGEGCIDKAYKKCISTGGMVYPRHIKISGTHEIGDRQIEEGNRFQKPIIKTEDFVPKKYNRAIGGVFIIDADFVREHGYLPDTKWQNPRTDGKPFGDFRDDVAFRKYVKKHSKITAVDLPNLYRIRHSIKTY